MSFVHSSGYNVNKPVILLSLICKRTKYYEGQFTTSSYFPQCAMLINNSNRKKYDEFVFFGKQMLIFKTAQNKNKFKPFIHG